ncbi:hypothetical protein H1R20_g1139, partial [Candolleomyces eurysporus]
MSSDRLLTNTNLLADFVLRDEVKRLLNCSSGDFSDVGPTLQMMLDSADAQEATSATAPASPELRSRWSPRYGFLGFVHFALRF